MNTFRILVTAVALAFAASVPAYAAETHSHSQEAAHAEALAALTLDHGKRWSTDAALRKGMGEIRGALAANHAAIAKRSLDTAQARALGEKIESQVGYIVANCKLEPAADAQLHLVVAELVGAADQLQGKAAGPASKGATRAIKAVNAYGRHFEHPGWKPMV